MSDILDLDFAVIENEKDVKSFTQSINITIHEISNGGDEKSLKQAINGLLNKITQQIISPSAPPLSKLMALMMLRQFTEKHSLAERKEDKNSKLFSIISSHALLKEMRNIAQNIDPMKQPQQKGKNLFPSSKTGNDFICLNLELLKLWASRFPVTSKKQHTTYKRFYDELIARKVIFPAEYKFLAFANKKTVNNQFDSNPYRTGAQQEQNSTPQPPQTGRSTISRSTDTQKAKYI